MNKETAIRLTNAILSELEKENLSTEDKLRIFINIAKIIDNECVESVFFERK